MTFFTVYFPFFFETLIQLNWIPGPGLSEGDGDDWVRVVAIDKNYALLKGLLAAK